MEKLNQLNMAQNKNHQAGEKKPNLKVMNQKKVNLIG
jgi:hypothetical protein